MSPWSIQSHVTDDEGSKYLLLHQNASQIFADSTTGSQATNICFSWTPGGYVEHVPLYRCHDSSGTMTRSTVATLSRWQWVWRAELKSPPVCGRVQPIQSIETGRNASKRQQQWQTWRCKDAIGKKINKNDTSIGLQWEHKQRLLMTKVASKISCYKQPETNLALKADLSHSLRWGR